MLILTSEKDEHSTAPSQPSSVTHTHTPSPQLQERMVREEEAAGGGVPRLPDFSPVESVPPRTGMPTFLNSEEGRSEEKGSQDRWGCVCVCVCLLSP